jgi:Flp pilus assembly protein TadG
MSKTSKTSKRRSLLSRFTRAEDGVAALEFGLAAPAFFAALLGVMELGRIAFTAAALHYAAEEGTRYAIVRMGTATTETIQAHANARLIGVVDSETAVITTTAPIDEVSGSRVVSVRVEMEYQPWFSFILPNFTLAGESKGFLAFAHNT